MSRLTEPITDAEALFRHELISAVLVLTRQGLPKSAAVREVAAISHIDHRGSTRRVSERTLWRWLERFHSGGFSALSPPRRPEKTRALSPQLIEFFRIERAADPGASIPELLRRARIENVIGHDEKISRVTAWRAMRRAGIETRKRKTQAARQAKRRFGFAERMQMVMADFKHFRVGPSRKKRAALYLLDDATRMGLGVWVSTSEQAAVMLRALHEVIQQHGLMDVLYLDRGSAFRAEDVSRVCAQLGVNVILGSPHYPQARGKIERFNRSVNQRLLAGLDRADHAPADDEALALLLRHDLREIYNHLPHEKLAQRSPHQMWTSSERALRPVADPSALTAAFSVPQARTVTRDNVISYEGVAYEMPAGHAGERVTLWRRPLEDDALFFSPREGEWQRLLPVNRQENALRPTGREVGKEAPLETPGLPSSSQRALSRALSPMVDESGNYKEDR